MQDLTRRRLFGGLFGAAALMVTPVRLAKPEPAQIMDDLAGAMAKRFDDGFSRAANGDYLMLINDKQARDLGVAWRSATEQTWRRKLGQH